MTITSKYNKLSIKYVTQQYSNVYYTGQYAALKSNRTKKQCWPKTNSDETSLQQPNTKVKGGKKQITMKDIE